MYKLQIQPINSNVRLDLSPSTRWTVTDIDGLDPVEKTIYTQKLYGIEGEYVTGSYIPSRQIIITMALGYPVEEQRRYLFNHYSAGKEIILTYWPDYVGDYAELTDNSEIQRQHGPRKVTGTIEKIEINQYNNPQMAQITIKCPSPYFSGQETHQTITQSTNPVVFNYGDVDTGFTMVITVEQDKPASDDMTIMLEGRRFGNAYTYQQMTIEGLELYRGDTITLCTVSGNMRATLYRGYNPYKPINIFGYIKGDMLRLPGQYSRYRESNIHYIALKITPVTITADVYIKSLYSGV